MSAADTLRYLREHGWRTRVTQVHGRTVRSATRLHAGRREYLALDLVGDGRHLACVELGDGGQRYGACMLDDAGLARAAWGGVPRTRLTVARVPGRSGR